ncbi:AdeC/AdeK/OprM family multidrug efflux complex outer membrane factor [soil metagenome]
MSKSIRRFSSHLVLATALVLAGCKTVGPDFTSPAGPTAPGYAMAGDAVMPGLLLTAEARTAGAWWNAVGDDKVDAVVRLALKNSPTVAEAEAVLRKAQAEIRAEQGAAGMQAQGTAGGQRERINTQSFGFSFPSPTINLFEVGAKVTYDLEMFGGGRRAVEARQAQAEAEARRADAAYLTLTGNVVLQAARVARGNSRAELVQAIIADDKRMIEMVRAAERAGGEAPSASTGGLAQLAQDEALLPPLLRDQAEARHQLALLVGKSPAEWTAPNFTAANFKGPASIPVALPSMLVRGRPDILAAEADLHEKTALIGVARAAQYPDIRLSAGLTQGAIRPLDLFSYDSSGWNVGAALTGPLIKSRELKARREAAVADAQASLARYQGTVLRAFVQVSDVMSDLAHDTDQFAAVTRAQIAAEVSVSDYRKAYDLGASNLYSVVEAQRRLTLARQKVLDAQSLQFVDLVQLYLATASDWRDAAG